MLPGFCLPIETKSSIMKNMFKSIVLFMLLAVGLSSCMCYGPGYGRGYYGGGGYRYHGGYHGHHGGGYYRR